MEGSVASSESDMVELKNMENSPSSPTQPGNGNLLHPSSASPSPPSPVKAPSEKHARFNIEKVDSPTTAPESNAAHNQNTIHDMETIGYATHEAVPLTMFYRNEASNTGHAKARPTLEELHKGFDEIDEMEVCYTIFLNLYTLALSLRTR